MKLAVLGATGMLGQHTLRAGIDAGHQCIALYRSAEGLRRLEGLPVELRQADLSDPATLRKALRGVDAVVNAAAYYPTVPRPWREEVARATGLMADFYTVAAEASVGRIVYLGGAIALPRRMDAVPANGSERYAASPANRNPYLQVKWALDEQALQQAALGMPVCIGIPSMTFGEYDYGPTTGQLIVGIARGALKHYVRGERNVVYGGDAGRGLVMVAERGVAGERYLLTGANTDMDTVVALIARLSAQPMPKPTPLPIAKLVAAAQKFRYLRLGGALPTISETAIAVMSAGQHLDGSTTEARLGYRPQVGLEESIARSLEWFRTQQYC